MPDTASPPKALSARRGDLRSLVDALVKMDRDRDLGKLSALRAWWRPSARYFAVPVMGALVGSRLDHPVWTAIPALFALHRLHRDQPQFNLGASCRALAGDNWDQSFAPHFRRLLACGEGSDLEDLTSVLRRLAARAQTEAVPINYFQLGIDLFRWMKSPEQAREVKTAWAKEYYRSGDEEAEAAPDATPPAP